MWYDTLKFSVDWLNVRIDHNDLDEVMGFFDDFGLNMLHWTKLERGQNFYRETYSFSPAGYSAITLSCSPESDGSIPLSYTPETPTFGILLSISGDGCRWFDRYVNGGLHRVACALRDSYPLNVSRMDVCMDIFDKQNPIVPLFQEFIVNAYTENWRGLGLRSSRIQRKELWADKKPVRDPDVKAWVDNVYIGNRGSSTGCCVCYNKKVEVLTKKRAFAQEIFDLNGVTDYWYRVEYRAKYSHTHPNSSLSNPCFQCYCDKGVISAFYFVADNLFTFIDQKYNETCRSKCPINEIWCEFLNWLDATQNYHFAELQADPKKEYVPIALERNIRWMKRFAALFVKGLEVMEYDPQLQHEILVLGEHKLASSYYAKLNFEFDEKYGCGD